MKNIEEIEFRLPTVKEVFGDTKGRGQSSIFKKCGTTCAATDYALCNGVYNSLFQIKEDNATSEYLINDTENSLVQVVDIFGVKRNIHHNSTLLGIRPALKYSDIKEMCSEERRGENGQIEVDCYAFEITSSVVDERKQIELDYQFRSGFLNPTDKKMIRYYKDYFSDKFYYESILTDGNEKFQRVKVDLIDSIIELSDKKKYKNGEYIWQKVEHPTLLIDKKKNLAVFKKVIFGGLPFANCNKMNDLLFPYKKELLQDFLTTKLPAMVKPAMVLQKSTGINQLEFSINPFDIASLYQNGNITLKNASGESVKINLKDKKEQVKINRKAKIGFEKLI